MKSNRRCSISLPFSTVFAWCKKGDKEMKGDKEIKQNEIFNDRSSSPRFSFFYLPISFKSPNLPSYIKTFRINYKFIFCALIFLMLAAVCHAAFFVYFKDGTSREVKKIEFKGQYVELYLTTGKVIRLRKDSIDFKTTGIEPPSEENKVIIKGTRPDDKIVEKPQIQSTGPSQEELRLQWNQSKETAIAIRDTGSIRKGDTIHVAGINKLGHTVIAKMPDGNYKRIVINSEIFEENFEMKTQPAKVAAPVVPSSLPSETEQPSHISGTRIKTRIRPHSRISGKSKPSLAWPLLISMGLLTVGIVSTILLSKTDHQRPKRSGRAFPR